MIKNAINGIIGLTLELLLDFALMALMAAVSYGFVAILQVSFHVNYFNYWDVWSVLCLIVLIKKFLRLPA